MYERPVLLNPTLNSVGDDAGWTTVEQFSQAVAANTGNMAFLHAALKVVDDLQPVSRRPFRNADVKVWGCANFIAPNRDVKVVPSPIYDDGSPIVALGLGGQAPLSGAFFDIPENTVEWIRKVRSLAPGTAPNITLRGAYTYDLLKENGLEEGCVVLGCPSLFIAPHPDLGARIKRKSDEEPRFLGCAPGNPASNSVNCIEIERWMVETLTREGGSYLVQHPIEMLRIVRGDGAAQQPDTVQAFIEKLAPGMEPAAFIRWVKTHGRVFHDAPSWLFHNSGLDFVVSMRIHGAQMALQAGTPALVLAIDSRQIELCEVMAMPYILMSDFTPDMTASDLHGIVRKHDWAAYDDNRRALAGRLAEFLENNSLSPSAHLLRLT